MDQLRPSQKLHIAMFPWLAFGHLIPYLELAKCIAQKGHKISYISTARNIQRLTKIPPDLSPNINLVTFPLPHLENLPHDAEATMDIPTNKIPYLKLACDALQGSTARFLQASKPDWIILDLAYHWLPPIAANLGISCVTFSIFGAWTVTFMGSSTSALINGEDKRSKPEDFTVPPKWVPFPSKVAFRVHEARRIISTVEVNESGVSDFFRFGQVLAGCDAIILRSCMELEADFLRLVEELHGKPAIPIGLLPPSPPVNDVSIDDTWVTISDWLDKQNEKSVVYIALGSELEVSQDEITELALGLELSGLPFFWVFRKQHDSSIELPSGFVEHVEGRGMIWTRWAPQLKILAHESIGGFLTHCGYSSVLEALHFGHPLIMLPFAIDTGLIARVFEDKKVGAEVPRDEKDGSYTRNSMAETLRLVVLDEEGKVYRDNAKEMRKLVSDNELHERYIDHFIEFLQNHRSTCLQDRSRVS